MPQIKYIMHNGECYGLDTTPKTGYIDLLVVAGGGGGQGGTCWGGGGGAGGYYYRCGFTLKGGEVYSIQVGGGGQGLNNTNTPGCHGCNSLFANSEGTICISMCGGGGGGHYNYGGGASGGSGGGGGYQGSGGSGIAGQGNSGAGSRGGGGGAAAAGSSNCGGQGCQSDITGTSTWYAGGGSTYNGATACGKNGCGGGGNGTNSTGGTGCQGIVVVRYKTDGSNGILPTSTGGTKYTCGLYTIHCFTNPNGANTVANYCFVPVFK